MSYMDENDVASIWIPLAPFFGKCILGFELVD